MMRSSTRSISVHRHSYSATVGVLLALICVFYAGSARATLVVGNNYVYAQVEESSGLITVKVAPISPTAVTLSFGDHSYLAVMIGTDVFTNNPPANDNLPDKLTTTGSSTKIADTIFTTWTNLDGVDLIQKVYPVKFSKSGQIVISISFKNNNGSPVACAAQYILDTEINQNDKSKILTRYNYTSNWTQYPGFTGMPWFYITWEHDLPNSPSFSSTAPGNYSGQGYIDYPPLGLIVPDAVTVGDWTYLTAKQWGAYNGTGPYGDSGILLEWPAQGVPAGKTVEVARTSYGTGEFETCLGGLFGIFFYPHALTYDIKSKFYTPNPFLVDAYLFNTDLNNTATAVSLKLDVGPLLTITAPTGNITNNGKTEKLFAGSSLNPGDVAELNWTVKADFYKNCSVDTTSWLQFTSNSSIIPGDFAKPSPCLLPISIPCTVFDSLPPIVDTRLTNANFPTNQQVNVHDDRSTDDGLKSITYSFIGTDVTKFAVSINPTLIGSCDKGVHTVKVTQNDSTDAGCFFFTFTDCNSNISYDTMCFSGKQVAQHPDVTIPKLTLLKLLDQNNALDCSARCDSLLAEDDAQYDSGIKSIILTPGVPPVNMGLNVGTFAPGTAKVGFIVCMMDSTKNGSISVRATDVAGNFTDTVLTYCTTLDTNLPIVTVSALAGLTWHVTATEQKSWDRGLDSVIVSNALNVTINPVPTHATTVGQTFFAFDVTIVDSTMKAGFCVLATDLAGHRTALNCLQYNPESDIWCPNVLMNPPQNQNPNKVTIDVNDIHLIGTDTIGWDSGIDSVWLTSANLGRFIVPPGFPIHANFAHKVPSFNLAVLDTLNTDSVACITINANDIHCTTSITWCYPFIPDNSPPLVTSTATSRTSLSFHAADTLAYDRGLKHATLTQNTNFQSFSMALSGPTADLTLNVATPGKSAFGLLNVEDVWGALSALTTVQLAHSASVEVSSWAQNFGMKRSNLFQADSLPSSGQIVVPVYFRSTDSFSLARKGINEYQFAFALSGDPQIKFTGADVTKTASAGWSVTSNTVGAQTTIHATHAGMPALSDSTLPLINLDFYIAKDQSTRSATVQIVNDPILGSIIYNGARDTSVTGLHATAVLPAPYGTMGGTQIVVVGTCAPSLTANGTPMVVGMDRNFPNPFSKRTTIGYQVPAEALVTLVIYDAMGKEISRLVSTSLKPGYYSAIFDASSVAPGFYIVRLETNGKVISRSLVISK